jgi:CheY-like chemotaxis protein
MLPASIALDLRCEPTLPAILMDPIQIERVVINLVTNARDAMGQGGKLTVATRSETLSDTYLEGHPEARPGAYAVLVVTDEGVGMDRETRSRVFEPFFTTKGEGRGTGLGLSTVYGIVRQTGGHIRVESKVGAGTTFFAYLPASAEQPAAADAARDRAAAGPILYCESDEGVRSQVGQLLENAGFRVRQASGAAEALELLAAAEPLEPCVLLADMVTSGMTGHELAAAVRRYRPALPAVLFTGKVLDRNPRSETMGFWYANKRHGPGALLSAIHEAIRSGARAAGAPSPEASPS